MSQDKNVVSDNFTLRHRNDGGNTQRLTYWGADSETGELKDVLIGPIDHFTSILPTNSMNKKMIREGVTLDVEGARLQYEEVLSCYRDSGVSIHITPPDPYLPLQNSGERSQAEGAQQVKDWLSKEGVEVLLYEFDAHFVHADVTIVMLTDNLAAAVTDVVDPAILETLKNRGISIIDVPYLKATQLGCNVMSLVKDRVLLPKQNEFLVEACKAEGLTVFDPDVSAITVVGGGIHCMSLALRRSPYGQ